VGLRMFRSEDFTQEIYKTGEVAKILKVTPRTIMNYDKEGLIKFNRTETNRRIVFREDLLDFLDKQNILYRDDDSLKSDIIYARVSSNDQKQKGDLDRQALFLIESISNLQNPIILKEVGSGLNDKRPQLMKLITMVMNDEVRKVYITYKDRLTRFGFNYLEKIFSCKGVEIIVIKDVSKIKSVEEELVEDMMSLIASFSGKLYGLRSRKNKNNK
jgi:predicted site-specific integrase-resolvase